MERGSRKATDGGKLGVKRFLSVRVLWAAGSPSTSAMEIIAFVEERHPPSPDALWSTDHGKLDQMDAKIRQTMGTSILTHERQVTLRHG